MDKRGEITSTQIVIFVISIIGLAIAIFFTGLIFKGFDSDSDIEACRLSILTRATAPTVAQANVPLKCTTQKICVTDKLFGGECGQFTGEDNVVTVKVSGTDLEKAKQIEKIMAENMYICWSMTGQGKLDLFGKASDQITGNKDSTCIVCSRVAFDDEISNEVLDLVDLDSYLENNYIPLQGSSLTYIEAFTNRGANSFGSVSRIEEELSLGVESDKVISNGDGRQIAFVFAQAKTINVGTALRNLGLAATGATIAIPGKALASRLIFTPAGGVITLVLGGGAVATVAGTAYLNTLAVAGYCGEFTSTVEEDNLRQGCSLVQGVPYTVQNINSLCTGSIQSTP